MKVAFAVLAGYVCTVSACGSSPSSMEGGSAVQSSPAATREAGSCSGDTCAGADVSAGVSAVALDEQDARRCELEPAGALEVAWSQPLVDAHGSPLEQADCGALSPCVLDGSELRITGSDDGTLWLAAVATPAADAQNANHQEAGLWLAHYASDGTRLSGELVADARLDSGEALQYRLALVAGGQGSVLLGASEEHSTTDGTLLQAHSWVRRYGADGRRTGAGIEMDTQGQKLGAPLLAAAGDDALAVISGSKLTLLEQWAPRWTRAVEPSLEALLGDGQQRLWSFTPNDANIGAATLQQYREDGAPSWTRSFPRLVRDVHLALDADGDVVRSGVPISNPEQLPIYGRSVLLHKLSHEGDPVWLVELQPEPMGDAQLDNVGSCLAIDAVGTIWVEGPYYTNDPGGQLEPAARHRGFLLYEIAADGQRCIAHDMANSDGLQAMTAASGGGLYFVDYDGFGLMRTRR